MKSRYCILIVLMMICMTSTHSQAPFAIKKWNGRYPSMNGDYPLTFLSFRGWLPPVPHYFVRLYPSHYYYKTGAVPVYAPKTYTDLGWQGVQRVFFRVLDRNNLKQVMNHISSTQLKKEAIKQIDEKVWNAKNVSVQDIYQLSSAFSRLDRSISLLQKSAENHHIAKSYRMYLIGALNQSQMIQRFTAEPGEKLQAMEELKEELLQMSGECDYLQCKVRYYKQSEAQFQGLSFLGN